MNKKITFFAIILLLSSLLNACGRTPDPNCGSYVCEQILMGEEKIKVDTIHSTAPVLQLYNNADAELIMDEQSFTGMWNNADGVFTLTIGGQSSTGELENGICRIDLMNTGLIYCFFSENSPLPKWDREEPPREKDDIWSGDWYGYWSISNADGRWAELDRLSFDCCAHIDMYTDGVGEIRIWDESGKYDDPMANVNLSLSKNKNETYGTARSESGNFYAQEIGKSRWVLRPNGGELAQLISFSSHYSSPEGSFDYEFCLRPWGCRWDDLPEDSQVQLPYYFYDWYLPMLDSDEPMPDEVDFEGIAVKPEKIYRGDVE